MLPKAYSPPDQISKKLHQVARDHHFVNGQTISHIFYDVFKLAYYALKRKKAGIRIQPSIPITLKRTEITRAVRIVDYHHSNDKTFTADHELCQCFKGTFTENDALKFFEKFVEGETQDKFGRRVYIDLEDGVKFMYKNPLTERHEMKSEYYKSDRGKRLPWIKHALHNTTNIYTCIDGDEREIMYLAKYDLPSYDDQSNKHYWAVIVKKNKKDRASPYKFKTAFPIFDYNNLLARLERYDPIIYVQNFGKI